MIEKIEMWMEGFLVNGVDRIFTALLIFLCGVVVIRIILSVLNKFLKAGKLRCHRHARQRHDRRLYRGRSPL